MIVTFEYRISWICCGTMTVDLDKFFPNRVGETRKLFRLMVPNLDSQKIREVEAWLSEKEVEARLFGKNAKRYKKYLEIFREVQK
ncbi:hypothetical protein [Cuneatibacter caecimuris]|uniref:Uncharacterized protein n=1 Tax=Cuneatibacter caecimuris TaxID=1796618 RepID=A0A4Q7PPI6_9FIRM|nr:hypothetical protein [Cuneatibacter caecimuris]RZT02921.1 hypothetical protein EV209_1051 [Cuneatibacter caecimuris]